MLGRPSPPARILPRSPESPSPAIPALICDSASTRVPARLVSAASGTISAISPRLCRTIASAEKRDPVSARSTPPRALAISGASNVPSSPRSAAARLAVRSAAGVIPAPRKVPSHCPLLASLGPRHAPSADRLAKRPCSAVTLASARSCAIARPPSLQFILAVPDRASPETPAMAIPPPSTTRSASAPVKSRFNDSAVPISARAMLTPPQARSPIRNGPERLGAPRAVVSWP